MGETVKTKKPTELDRLFKTDKVSEEDGVWVDYSETLGIKIRRAGRMNKEYVRMFEKEMRPYRKQERLGIEMKASVAEKMLRDVFAHTVVVAWRGIDDPCTPENVGKYFEEYPDLFDDIRSLAVGREIFTADIEGDSGN